MSAGILALGLLAGGALLLGAGRASKTEEAEPQLCDFRWVEPEDRDCEIEGCTYGGDGLPDFADVWCDDTPCCIKHAANLYNFNETSTISDPVEQLAETWGMSYDQAYDIMSRGTTLKGLKGLKP